MENGNIMNAMIESIMELLQTTKDTNLTAMVLNILNEYGYSGIVGNENLSL